MNQLPADFDPQLYLKLHPDVAKAGADPTKHYLKHGRHEGRIYKLADSASERFFTSPPSDQNVVDLFRGQWSSKAARDDLTMTPGLVDLFHDERIKWGLEQIGSVNGSDVLELGPLEGGHSYMLHQAGANVTAIEANGDAFLKCLCMKEIMRMESVRFLLGDAISYLEKTERRFDAVLASGILYHMEDPLRLLRGIEQATDRVILWTHFYDAEAISKRDDAALFDPPAPLNGTRYRGSVRRYPGEAMSWQGFSGGPAPKAVWMLKDDILCFFSDHGFDRIEIGNSELGQANGPCVLAAMVRTR